VKHSREIPQVGGCQAKVLRIEIQSCYPVASGRIESKVAIFAAGLFVVTHGLAYLWQTFLDRLDVLIVEDDELRTVLCYDSEFHDWLLFSSGVKFDGGIFDPVAICEEEA